MKMNYAFIAVVLMILAVLLHAILYQFESKTDNRTIVNIGGYLRFVMLLLAFICLGFWE